MKYDVSGTVMQTVGIDLAPGETVYSQTATMCWMTDGVNMHTNTGGGLMKGLQRTLSGGGLFITDFTGLPKGGHVAFAPRFPGTIMARTLKAGESLICRKETFLCAEKSVTLEIAWQKKLGVGVFGGAGFILQKVIGPGTVFLDLSGEVVSKTLAAGETLKVHAGHVGVHDPSITFDIQMMKGFGNMMFGGEGLFLASLTGPGQVHLQSMPVQNLAEEIGRYLPQHEASQNTGGDIAAGVAGGLVRGIFGGQK